METALTSKRGEGPDGGSGLPNLNAPVAEGPEFVNPDLAVGDEALRADWESRPLHVRAGDAFVQPEER